MSKQTSSPKTSAKVEIKEAITNFLAKNPGKSHSLDEIKASIKQNPALIIKVLASMSKDRLSKVKFSNENGNKGYHFIGAVHDRKSHKVDTIESKTDIEDQINQAPAQPTQRRVGKKSIMCSILSMVIESKGSPKPLDTKIVSEKLGIEITSIERIVHDLVDSNAISGQYFEMFDQYILAPTENSKTFLEKTELQLKSNPIEEEQLYLFDENNNTDKNEETSHDELHDHHLSEIINRRALSKISKNEKQSAIKDAMDFAILSRLKDQGPHAITNLGSSLEGTISPYGFIGRNLITKRVKELESAGLIIQENHSKNRQKCRITEKGIKSIPTEALLIARSTDSKNQSSSDANSDNIALNSAPKNNSNQLQTKITSKYSAAEIKETKTEKENKTDAFSQLYERGMLIADAMIDNEDLKQILDEMLMIHSEVNLKIEKIASFVKSVSEAK